MVGGAFNLFYGLLYILLREELSPQPANALALILSTLAGTLGHRRVTFGVRGWERTVNHQALGLLLLAFSLAVTAGSLWLLEASVETPTRPQELAVLIASNLGTGLVRFAAFRVAMVTRAENVEAFRPCSACSVSAASIVRTSACPGSSPLSM